MIDTWYQQCQPEVVTTKRRGSDRHGAAGLAGRQRQAPATSDGRHGNAMSERKSILLRLDPAVHDALAGWAGDDLRSTNAQIEFLLRRALADAGLPSRAKES